MLTFASWMDFSKSTVFFDLSFQCVILHLLYSVRTQFVHLFFGHPLTRLAWGLSLNTWKTFLLISILLSGQSNPTDLFWQMKLRISKSPNSCFNSTLYHFVQFSYTTFPSNIILKKFIRLWLSLFNVQTKTTIYLQLGP
jgi:hypothetical protein